MGGGGCINKREIERQKEIRKRKKEGKKERKKQRGIMRRSNPREIPSTFTFLSHIKQRWTQFYKEKEGEA